MANKGQMPFIIIKNLNKTISVSDTTRPLLFLLQEHYIDWMHACGGKGRCTTCKLEVIAGKENLCPDTPAETKYRKAGALSPIERLACQVTITGDVTIRVPDECKLPHLAYTD